MKFAVHKEGRLFAGVAAGLRARKSFSKSALRGHTRAVNF